MGHIEELSKHEISQSGTSEPYPTMPPGVLSGERAMQGMVSFCFMNVSFTDQKLAVYWG